MKQKTVDRIAQKPGGLKTELEGRNAAIKRLSAKIESDAKVIAALRLSLRDCPCPRPANSDPDDTTIGQCMDLKHCGCCYGTALAATDEQTVGKKS